ncbi:uncharacterized protein PODANS_1_24490 [Podospora anserina S mat+]|uniref:Efficient mitochondria targeting-associated protein 19 n=4 Tax=Podospora TaxID=5144 RepID=B2ASS3_PODAN|nr:uncharacterized protein PODANS_1_24490 [Podospora anserina S mat+]KAK4661058.1 hypothetical protein QC762_124490 [Podospora pseudocomata]KAK4674871.1 hypothetical protein QC763_124490 [Podospora pseudopauciseta]KAK4683364.1 hypothetical protein QC764_124490 [Podospora pseudoanserina]CAP67446.1 unnamed protein product [Podospora anserina S mat+]CDP24860.1 Putative protein of unknown function [Podospora anserina S mat+]
MAVENTTWRNNVWLVWFYIVFPITVLIDLQEVIYPSSLLVPADAPLHFAYKAKQDYIAKFNDPIVQWSPETASGHDSWMGLFIHLEFFFLLPVMIYAMYKMGIRQKGTSGPDELLFFVYALYNALTTAVCIHDTFYWDKTIWADESQLWTLRSAYYAPFVFIPLLGAFDMGSRILSRFKAADAAAESKKAE